MLTLSQFYAFNWVESLYHLKILFYKNLKMQLSYWELKKLVFRWVILKLVGGGMS
jgi:hypothetical protein